MVDLSKLGERTIQIDCDVIQADGGTRCASITGAYLALRDACQSLVTAGRLAAFPLCDSVAAVSVGIVKGQALLDLDYVEDSSCDTDMNIVMTGTGGIVEIQGSAEGTPFSTQQLESLLALGRAGIAELILKQQVA